jgi:Fe-S-cluster containining protein
MSKNENQWWEKGVRFQCQGSGQCCASHGEYGFVYVTKEDRQNMAKVLGIDATAFTKKYCNKTNGFFHLKENIVTTDCVFLQGKKCTVYSARPTQCRTWPFWPEAMNAKTWTKEILTFCPGVNKGPVVPAEEIKKQLQEQKDWEAVLDKEAREHLHSQK